MGCMCSTQRRNGRLAKKQGAAAVLPGTPAPNPGPEAYGTYANSSVQPANYPGLVYDEKAHQRAQARNDRREQAQTHASAEALRKYRAVYPPTRGRYKSSRSGGGSGSGVHCFVNPTNSGSYGGWGGGGDSGGGCSGGDGGGGGGGGGDGGGC